ncbi:MAG: hypothetical protein R3A10_07510 [Caldilineaceae bacterium]
MTASRRSHQRHYPDAEIPPGAELTLEAAVARPITVALNNSFGFGGHNATTVFRRYADT